MKLAFCPNLQKNWTLESIDYKSLNEIDIRLNEYLEQGSPPVDGRHGNDILSWPSQLKRMASIKIEISEAMYFNISDSVSPDRYNEIETKEGDTFQRITHSELIQRYATISHKGLFHYRLITQNEVIEFLTFSAPTVIQS